MSERDLLALAVAAGEEAGKALREAFGGVLAVSEKSSPTDLVSEDVHVGEGDQASAKSDEKAIGLGRLLAIGGDDILKQPPPQMRSIPRSDKKAFVSESMECRTHPWSPRVNRTRYVCRTSSSKFRVLMTQD